MQSIFRGNKTRKRMNISPSSKETCAICLEEMDKLYKISNLSCKNKHPFHNKCLNEWIEHGNESCPTCRQDIKFSDYKKGLILMNKNVDEQIIVNFMVDIRRFSKLLIGYRRLYYLKNKNIPAPILYIIKNDERTARITNLLATTTRFADRLYELKDDNALRHFIRDNGYNGLINYIVLAFKYMKESADIVNEIVKKINLKYRASEMGLMIPSYSKSKSRDRKIDYIAQRFSNIIDNARIPLSY
jgi:hypothetical protein